MAMTYDTAQAKHTLFLDTVSSTRLPRWPERVLVLTCEASSSKGHVLYGDQSSWDLIS